MEVFDSARNALRDLGFDIPTFAAFQDLFYEGVMDGVRTQREAARMLVPGVGVEHPSGIEFYMSFQPMRLARDVSEPSVGFVIQSVELDPDAKRWTYAYADGHEATVSGERGLRSWVAQLNARQAALAGGLRFVIAKPRYEQTKLIKVDEAHLADLRALLGV